MELQRGELLPEHSTADTIFGCSRSISTQLSRINQAQVVGDHTSRVSSQDNSRIKPAILSAEAISLLSGGKRPASKTT